MLHIFLRLPNADDVIPVDAQECVFFHFAELKGAEGREVAVERDRGFSYKAVRRPVVY